MMSYSRALILSVILLPQVFANAQTTMESLAASEMNVDQDATTDAMMFPGKEGKIDSGLKLGFGYYTNAYALPTAKQKDNGNFTLRMKPRLRFSGSGKMAKFTIGADGMLDLVFGGTEKTALLINGNIFAKGEFNPKGDAKMTFDQNLKVSTAVQEIYAGSLTQLAFSPKIGTVIRPMGGDVTISANLGVNSKSYLDIVQPAQGATIDPAALGSWAYTVRGKLAYDVVKDLSIYVASKWGTYYANANNNTSTHPFGVNGGVGGQITPSLKADFNAGYTRTYVKLISTDTLLDSTSIGFSTSGTLDWKISDDSDLQLNLSRDDDGTPVFLDSFENSIGLNFRQRFADKFILQLAPSFSYYEYGKPLLPDNSARVAGNHRSDISLADTEELSYYPTDWFNCGIVHNGKYRWTNSSTFDITQGQVEQTGSNYQNITNDLFLAYVGFSY